MSLVFVFSKSNSLQDAYCAVHTSDFLRGLLIVYVAYTLQVNQSMCTISWKKIFIPRFNYGHRGVKDFFIFIS